MEREREATLMFEIGDDEKRTEAETEKKNAEDMRNKALETFTETRKRKIEDGADAEKSKRKRNNTTDATLGFLREKISYQKESDEKERELKQKEIELRSQQQSMMEVFRSNPEYPYWKYDQFDLVMCSGQIFYFIEQDLKMILGTHNPLRNGVTYLVFVALSHL